HTWQRKKHIVLSNQIKRWNITAPFECQCCANNSRFRVRTSARRQRNNGSDALLDLSCSEYRPASEAVPHDPNPRWVDLCFRIVCPVIKQMIEEKSNIRHAVRNPGFNSRGLLLVGFIRLTRQFRCYDLRMI